MSTRLRILEKHLTDLEKHLTDHYNKPKYKMWSSYGKYHIARYQHGEKTVTVARRLSKEEAEGFMKLLKENDDD